MGFLAAGIAEFAAPFVEGLFSFGEAAAAAAPEVAAAGDVAAGSIATGIDAATGAITYAAPTAAEAATLGEGAAFGGTIYAPAVAGGGAELGTDLLGTGAGAGIAGGLLAAGGPGATPAAGGPPGAPPPTPGPSGTAPGTGQAPAAVPGQAPAAPGAQANVGAPSSGAVSTPLNALQYENATTQLLASGGETTAPSTDLAAAGEEATLPPGAQPAAYQAPAPTPNQVVTQDFSTLSQAEQPPEPASTVTPPASTAATPPASTAPIDSSPTIGPGTAPPTDLTPPAASAASTPSLLSKVGSFAKDYGWAAGLAPLAITMMRGEGQVPPQFGTLENQAGALNTAGQANIAMAAANQLTPGQAAQIATTRESLVNQLRQQIYSSGQDPDNSTAFSEGMVGVEQQLTAMTQTMIANTLTAGLQETGQSATDLIAAGNAQIAQDTAFTNALSAAATALGTTVAVSTIAGSAARKA